MVKKLLHCDRCDKELGESIQEIVEAGHYVGAYLPWQISIPDMVCIDRIEKFPTQITPRFKL